MDEELRISSFEIRIRQLELENKRLKEEIENLKSREIENTVLRTRLHQETLANLEMQITLDMHNYLKEIKE